MSKLEIKFDCNWDTAQNYLCVLLKLTTYSINITQILTHLWFDNLQNIDTE